MHQATLLTLTEPLPKLVPKLEPSLSGHKRTWEQLASSEGPEEVAYAQYGITRGKVPCKRDEEFSCIIFCTGWPSWALAALSRNIDVKLIVLGDDTWHKLVQRIAPSSEIVVWGDSVKELVWPLADFVFSDVDPSQGKLNTLWPYITKLIVSLKAARKPPSSWHHQKLSISHQECGGVTNGSWYLNFYSPSAVIETCYIPPQAQRDLSSIIDSMCSSGIPCSAPRSIDMVKVPTVHELRPGTFHYQGLLPWAIYQPIVIAPNVYSATKFCRRKLTGKEMMHVLDIPDWVGQLLQSNEIKELIADRKNPSYEMRLPCKRLDFSIICQTHFGFSPRGGIQHIRYVEQR